MQHYTTIEQSKKLLELGLNPKTADFEYQCVGFTMHTTRPTDDFKYKVMLKEQNIPHESKYDIPCWSLGALLDVLKTRKDCHFITMHSSYSANWILSTSYYKLANWKEKEILGETLIDTVYNTVVWLLENGYIEKGE